MITMITKDHEKGYYSQLLPVILWVKLKRISRKMNSLKLYLVNTTVLGGVKAYQSRNKNR